MGRSDEVLVMTASEARLPQRLTVRCDDETGLRRDKTPAGMRFLVCAIRLALRDSFVPCVDSVGDGRSAVEAESA